MKVKNVRGGSTSFGLDYKWDASRDLTKKFSVVYFMDLYSSNHQRVQLVFNHPDRHFAFLVGHKIEGLDQILYSYFYATQQYLYSFTSNF